MGPSGHRLRGGDSLNPASEVMPMRALRAFRVVLKVTMLGALVVWVAAAPFVWLLQDGLGPDMVESGWGQAVLKFLVGWGGPALGLAVLLFVLWLVVWCVAGRSILVVLWV